MAKYWNGYQWVTEPRMAKAEPTMCEHGRASNTMCPHCLGVNERVDLLEAEVSPPDTTIEREPVSPNAVTIPLTLHPEKVVYAPGKEIPDEPQAIEVYSQLKVKRPAPMDEVITEVLPPQDHPMMKDVVDADITPIGKALKPIPPPSSELTAKQLAGIAERAAEVLKPRDPVITEEVRERVRRELHVHTFVNDVCSCGERDD